MSVSDIEELLDEAFRDLRRRVHFVGVGGSGVGALAEHRALSGGRASGSDRAFDRGFDRETPARLRGLGVELFPQDGSGVPGAALVVASGAVEAAVPDLERARRAGVPVVSRAAYLARLGAGGTSVAVAGSGGKTTTTAMLWRILHHAGLRPALVAGGALLGLRGPARLGHAAVGPGPLVYEADESDGSLVLHAPEVGLVLNLHLDHMAEEALLEQYRAFAARCRRLCLVGSDPRLDPVAAAAPHAERIPTAEEAPAAPEGWGSRLRVFGVEARVPLPGAPNAENARAALAAAKALGVAPQQAAAGLSAFEGVARRFERVGEARGVVVVDDFAHNPAKLAASLQLARTLGRRVLAWWQPHGFAPTRLLFADLVEAFSAALGPDDRLALAPIYYAGGTVRRDVSSAELAAACRARGAPVSFVPDRARHRADVARAARRGDVVLVLGARDPTLPAHARALLAAIADRPG